MKKIYFKAPANGKSTVGITEQEYVRAERRTYQHWVASFHIAADPSDPAGAARLSALGRKRNFTFTPELLENVRGYLLEHGTFGKNAARVGDAFVRLETALAEAIQQLEKEVLVLQRAGVKLSKQSHAGSEPAGPTELDRVQARANHLRGEVLPKFGKACQKLGLMVSRPKER